MDKASSKRLVFVVIAVGVLIVDAASAHHSRSNYDMDTFIEYDGTVVEFAWKNPHAFVVIDTFDDSGRRLRLLLEMNSKPILSGMGWAADSIAIGDLIHVRGNPDRRTDRKQLFVAYIVNRDSDSDRLWSFGRPSKERKRQQKANPVVRKPLVGSTDFSGIWNRARVTGVKRVRQDPFSPAKLNLTAKGEAAIVGFDPNDDPSFECLPNTLPKTIVPTYLMQITRDSDDLLTIRYEFNNGYREVHLDQDDFPDDLEPTRMGYSIGKIEDGALIIKSKYFSYDRWGNGRGVPSGERKEVFERYTLVKDGKRLEVSFTVSDPEYLSGPVEPQLGAYVLRNNIEFSDFSCDPDTAVRHLTGK